MRKTDKDRSIKLKQKQANKARNLGCKHLQRRHYVTSGDGQVYLICTDCGERLRMLSHTVSGLWVDPQSVKKSINTKHG